MTARTRERGASLPETAMIMALLLAMIFGIIDFGRALYTYSFVAQLAREGARWAIVRGASCTAYTSACPAQSGTTDVQPYIRGLNEGALNANQIGASLNFTTSRYCPAGGSGTVNNKPGCVAEVTVTYPFSFMLPGMPGTINMSSTSEMVIAN